VSNQKAKFVPREHEFYHRIAPYKNTIFFKLPLDLTTFCVFRNPQYWVNVVREFRDQILPNKDIMSLQI
jgi:hypothetical protein